MEAAIIAKTNDDLRAKLPEIPKPHRLILSEGVQALGMSGIHEVISKVKEFNDFNKGNDPYGEHDCIFVAIGDKTYMCKIDYYDSSFEGFEEDGIRVFTLMDGKEY